MSIPRKGFKSSILYYYCFKVSENTFHYCRFLTTLSSVSISTSRRSKTLYCLFLNLIFIIRHNYKNFQKHTFKKIIIKLKHICTSGLLVLELLPRLIIHSPSLHVETNLCFVIRRKVLNKQYFFLQKVHCFINNYL